MKFILLPWKHELVFKGTSVLGINSETKKFCSQVVKYYPSLYKLNIVNQLMKSSLNFFSILQDSWDSIDNNNFSFLLLLFFIFLLEGLLDVVEQVYMVFCLTKFLLFLFILIFEHLILQLQIYKTPKFETLKYQIMKRIGKYEVCCPFLPSPAHFHPMFVNLGHK